MSYRPIRIKAPVRGAIPPLPNTPPWRGVQLQKAQGQFYVYLLTFNLYNQQRNKAVTNQNKVVLPTLRNVHSHTSLSNVTK